MRNEWYPSKQAEYMTASRFRELGLTRDDIGERDITFGTLAAAESDAAQGPEAPTAAVRTTAVRVPGPTLPLPLPLQPMLTRQLQQPEKAHTILTSVVPETLTFHRNPIPAPAPAPPTQSVSPLVASANPGPAHDQKTPLAIYGSVSATDIVGHIKGLLVGDVEGSRIVLGPENIRFRGLSEDTDRLKALGRWEVDISVGGTGLEPVRKVIEILPSAEGSSEGDTQPAS
jgi:hypothetical protein